MDGENLREKYIAFLCLATVFRRNEHHTELKLLFQKYGKQFENESLYFHYKALMHKANQEFLQSIQMLRRIIHDNVVAAENPGVLHNYAESIIHLIENGEELEEVLPLKTDGLAKLNEAILLDEYAKFYATKARFLTFDKYYDEAKASLKKAIDLEKTGHDYQLRLARYYQQLSNIEVKLELDKSSREHVAKDAELEASIHEFNQLIDEKIKQQDADFVTNTKETQAMIEEMKQQNLQMLGFFTAIISFTVGTFQILQNQTFASGFALLLTLAGVLLIVYAGFSYTLLGINQNDSAKVSKHKFKKRFLPIIIIGIGLIIISIATYKFGWLGDVY